MVWVLPGVCDVFAKSFELVSILINDDLPTLDRPITASSGKLFPGNSSNFTRDETKTASLISIENK
jgi:hypothetical protein